MKLLGCANLVYKTIAFQWCSNDLNFDPWRYDLDMRSWPMKTYVYLRTRQNEVHRSKVTHTQLFITKFPLKICESSLIGYTWPRLRICNSYCMNNLHHRYSARAKRTSFLAKSARTLTRIIPWTHFTFSQGN